MISSWSCICGHVPCDGLDCGIMTTRKRPDPKPPAEMARIRADAWATRRAKYGERGHA